MKILFIISLFLYVGVQVVHFHAYNARSSLTKKYFYFMKTYILMIFLKFQPCAVCTYFVCYNIIL